MYLCTKRAVCMYSYASTHCFCLHLKHHGEKITVTCDVAEFTINWSFTIK